MLDPYLAAIVQAAEDGAECPILWMTLTSGDLVVGTPRASDVFIEGTHKSLVAANVVIPGAFESQSKIDKRRAAGAALAEQAVAHLDAKVEPSQRAMTVAERNRRA